MLTLFGSAGSGSAAVELALLRCGLPYRVQRASTWDPDSIMEYEFDKGLIDEPEKYDLNGLFPPGVLSKADKEWVLKWYPAAKTSPINLSGKTDVLGLAALAEQARVVVSCDTGVVHLASAFGTPQVVLYGPINPFHWRPQHSRAAVVSAAQPEEPLTRFNPRMKGAPMERISTGVVIRATEDTLAAST